MLGALAPMPLTGPGFDAVIDAYLATFGVPPDRPHARPDVGNTRPERCMPPKGGRCCWSPGIRLPTGSLTSSWGLLCRRHPDRQPGAVEGEEAVTFPPW